MTNSLRRASLPALAACLTLVARLSGADAPTTQPKVASPTPAVVAPAATPAGAPTPSPQPTVRPLPKALEGVVTQDEFTAYVNFQQSLREDPEIKALNEQIRAKMNEMVDLQKKAQLAQQKAIEANPEIKAINDKIKARKTKPAMAPAPGAPNRAAPTPLAPTPMAPAPVVPTPVAK